MESIVNSDLFINRHLGLSDDDEQKMLSKLGFKNIDQFIDQVIPDDIHLKPRFPNILWVIFQKNCLLTEYFQE